MPLNYSSSFSDTFHSPHPSSSNLSYSLYMYCVISRPSSFIFITIDINIVVLLLPLCIYILCHGVNERLKTRPTSSSAALSHSDCFTYHMVTMELIGVFGYILNLAGICNNTFYVMFVGDFFTSINWFGQVFLHVLTCVERYLAVVRPITYLKLKNQKGIRIRNLSIGCAWLLSLVGMTLMKMTNFCFIIDLCLLTAALVIISFCSLSVLYVLNRPVPGDQGKDGERVDQSKQRAFCTTVVILGVLVVRFGFNVAWEVIFMSGRRSDCVGMAICVWFNVPTSLVLPLLFLHRAGKFQSCKNSTQKEKNKELQSEMTLDLKNNKNAGNI